MKSVLALVALGLIQACGSVPSGKKLDQRGRYFQVSTSGFVAVQVDYSDAQACSNELRDAAPQKVDFACSLTSTASTLPYKGSSINTGLGTVSLLHFKTAQACAVYAATFNKPSNMSVASCTN